MAASFQAGPEYRVTSPSGDDRSVLSTAVPALLPLAEQYPSIPIYSRASPHFTSLRELHNTAITPKIAQPLAIVRPATEAEAAETVRFCAEHELPVSIRCGGHDFTGRTLVHDAVLIDVRGLDTIAVDADRTSAKVGGGVISGTLLGFLDSHELFTPTGFCNQVGYVGWACGGGYNLMQGVYGLGVDQILGARIVTATGDVVDTDDDAELLWAVRGAGNGPFGVVTEIRVKLYPRPKLLGGFLMFSAAEGENVFAGFRELCGTSFPDAFSGDFSFAYAPQVGPIIMMLVSWVLGDGNEKEANAFLGSLRGVGNGLLDTIGEITPLALSKTIDSQQSKPIHFRTCTVSELAPSVANILLQNPPSNVDSYVVIHNLHGRALIANTGSCFANRNRHVVLGAVGALGPSGTRDDPEMLDKVKWADDWVTKTKETGMTMDQAYLNFSRPDEDDVVRFYGQEAASRLKGLKQKYDSGNLFSGAYPVLA